MKVLARDTSIYRPPFSRMPQTRGSRVLVCRGAAPRAAEADGRYEPRWHIASWVKRRAYSVGYGTIKISQATAAAEGWTHVVDGGIVRRQWAYVRGCGAWRRFPAQEVKYGRVTCKRCLKKLFPKGQAARKKG